MIALHVLDVKAFMGLLFTGTAFDSFYLVEGDIAMAINYHVDGKVNQDFYSEDELEELKIEEYQSWKDSKNIIVSMIKGKRLPGSMKLVLKALPKRSKDEPVVEGRIESYLLNIRFDNNELLLVTGVARSTFSMDRSGEDEWDNNVRGFLSKNGIASEVC